MKRPFYKKIYPRSRTNPFVWFLYYKSDILKNMILKSIFIIIIYGNFIVEVKIFDF